MFFINVYETPDGRQRQGNTHVSLSEALWGARMLEAQGYRLLYRVRGRARS